MLKKHFKNAHCEFYEQFSCRKRMFPIQSLGVECKVCLSHAGGLRWQNLFLVIVYNLLAWVSGLPEGVGERRFLDGGGGRGSFSPSALSLFRFHLSPFPQKRLILRLIIYTRAEPFTERPKVFHVKEKIKVQTVKRVLVTHWHSNWQISIY